MEMVDYFPLRSNSYKLPDPDPEPEEEQAAQHPVVVDFVYNQHEAQNGKTIAIKVSLQLPLPSQSHTRTLQEA
jgi:hypothetical protein